MSIWEEKVEKQKQNVIEDIQKAIVEAGGSFRRRCELESMTVGNILSTLLPNDVKFKIYYERPKQKTHTSSLSENGTRPKYLWYDWGRTVPSSYGAFCEKTHKSLCKGGCVLCNHYEKTNKVIGL